MIPLPNLNPESPDLTRAEQAAREDATGCVTYDADGDIAVNVYYWISTVGRSANFDPEITIEIYDAITGDAIEYYTDEFEADALQRCVADYYDEDGPCLRLVGSE